MEDYFDIVRKNDDICKRVQHTSRETTCHGWRAGTL
jgi:hypothetical protein